MVLCNNEELKSIFLKGFVNKIATNRQIKLLERDMTRSYNGILIGEYEIQNKDLIWCIVDKR